MDVVSEIREGLAAAADPSRAAEQQRYMKSRLPYRGVTLPGVRSTVRPLVGAHPLPDRASWEAAIRELWDGAAFREERYAALELAGHGLYRPFQGPHVMGLYRYLIVTGAWWDLVDWVAPHLVGPILRLHPDTEGVRMRQWAIADDLWVRRASLVCQLQSKDATDTALLGDVIAANLEGTPYGGEFFIRKAIGWALRQYARVDADWVRDFVAEHDAALSVLSRREALKHL